MRQLVWNLWVFLGEHLPIAVLLIFIKVWQAGGYVMFVAETRDLKLEPSTCTVSLPFVETPMAGIRGKEKRAPLKTRDATRENESSLLKLELNTCTVPLAFVEYPVACMRAKAKKAPLKTCHTTRQKKCLFLKLEFNTCTVPLAFVEHPVSCMREKKKRAPT